MHDVVEMIDSIAQSLFLPINSEVVRSVFLFIKELIGFDFSLASIEKGGSHYDEIEEI